MSEISEEDRRIAQTLMAVQYGQKHKIGLEPLVGSSPGPEGNVIMSVADSMIVDEHLAKEQMVVEYIHQVTAAADGSHYEPKVVCFVNAAILYLLITKILAGSTDAARA
jgi:hypothetical protein